MLRRRDILGGLAAAPLLAARRPNVLFVISDDLNNDFGGLGRLADIHTPNLDRLAGYGVRFERAYCQYPLCNPSRVSMFSGLYPTTTRVLDNLTPPRYALPDFVTLPQHLRSHGYGAAYVGKVFHLLDPASWQDNAPAPAREKVKQFNYWIEPVRPENTTIAEMLRGLMQPKSGAPETLEDYKIASDAIRLMNGFHAAGRPFFLAVGFRRPHVPFVAPPAVYEQYSPGRVHLSADFASVPGGGKDIPADAFRPNLDLFFEQQAAGSKAREMVAAYYGCVTFMDSQLGRLLDELEKLGLVDNTIVVMVADHGWHLGQKGMWAKMTLFENSACVPLIIADPRRKSPGARCRAIAESIDLYPTLLELCGLPAARGLEGGSLARFLDDPKADWDRPARTVMIRGGLLAMSIRTSRWRYTEWDEGRRGAELYDHERDSNELRNLAGRRKYAPLVADLKQQLRG
jgi:iduronate 2-sulfatase